MLDTEKIMEKLKNWVEELGEIQLEKLNSDFEINTKSAAIDLVTEVDELSEEFLLDKIQANYPQHAILSEESGVKDSDSDYKWIIDPIDGTTNYANGFIVFSISVALQYQGETILGVVYAPRVEQLYSAIKGKGAFLNGEEIAVSKITNLEEALIATGFPYDRATSDHNNIDNLSDLVTQVQGIRRTGSAAFDLCTVAGGVFDGYWELKLSIWDIAAGRLIVKEAGGKIISKEIDDDIFMIAGNKNIVDKIEAEIKLTP